jgi:hypothetical protein
MFARTDALCAKQEQRRGYLIGSFVPTVWRGQAQVDTRVLGNSEAMQEAESGLGWWFAALARRDAPQKSHCGKYGSVECPSRPDFLERRMDSFRFDDSGVMSQHARLLPVVMLLWAPRDGDKVLVR